MAAEVHSCNVRTTVLQFKWPEHSACVHHRAYLLVLMKEYYFVSCSSDIFIYLMHMAKCPESSLSLSLFFIPLSMRMSNSMTSLKKSSSYMCLYLNHISLLISVSLILHAGMFINIVSPSGCCYCCLVHKIAL